MANKKVTLKRVIDTSGNTDNIHPTTDWDQVESKPTTFTPTAHTHTKSEITDFAHTHTLSEITDAGTVAAIDTNASTTQFLRGDGTWATPADSDTNTTYTISAVDSSNDAIIRLTGSDATTDDIKLVAGANITLTPSGDNITIAATDTNTTYTLGSFGITATAAELNVLDGITATTTELNYTDGVTSAIQTQLNAKAPLASPALTGTPTAPTANSGTNTTQIATTAFVANALNGVAGGLNFAGSISLSTAKNGDELAAAGLTGPGDYLIVTATGNIQDTGTFVPLAVQAPGDEGDSTLPVTLETGDWIVYVNGTGGTMTVAIINNTDTRFAPTTHTHTIANVTGLQTALDGKVAKAGDTMTGTLTTQAITMQNFDLTGVGALSFNDPGVNEGISWNGGNFSIYESPDNLTNAAGNLQIVSGGARRLTVRTDGSVEAPGSLNTPQLNLSGQPLQVSGSNLLYDGDAVWHEGNFNPASYLTTSGKAADANLLDGLDLHTGRNNEANKVVRTDGSGYIQAGWINTTSGIMGSYGAGANRYYASNDGYVRYLDRNSIKTQLGLTAKYDADRQDNTTDANYYTGVMGWGATDFNVMLRWGSGFIESWSSPANQPSTSANHWVGLQSIHYSNGSTSNYGMQMVMGAGDPNLTYIRGSWGTSPSAWRKLWHDGNDGSGSGLDADLLDGNHASAFAAASHTHDDRYYTESETNNLLGGKYNFSAGETIDVNSLSLGSKLYAGSSGGWSNRGPTGHNGSALLSILTHPGNYYSQLWFNTSGDEFYHRTIDNGSIRGWAKVWTSANFNPGSYSLTSHTHDDRYYTESEADGRFLNASGDTATGQIAFRTSGIGLERNYANNGIWFNSGADTNHILWNDYYGGPTTRGAANSGFDGIKWNTYRGIHIRGGLAGGTNIIVAENSSGSTADHRVKLYASGAEKLSTNTWGVAVTGDLEINGETAWNGGNLGFSLSGTTLTITTS